MFVDYPSRPCTALLLHYRHSITETVQDEPIIENQGADDMEAVFQNEEEEIVFYPDAAEDSRFGPNR